MDALTEGQQGSVNFTEELLLEGMPQLLDKKQLLERVELTPAMRFSTALENCTGRRLSIPKTH